MKPDPKRPPPGPGSPTLAEQVGAKAARKLKARRSATPGVWFGLCMLGFLLARTVIMRVTQPTAATKAPHSPGVPPCA